MITSTSGERTLYELANPRSHVTCASISIMQGRYFLSVCHKYSAHAETAIFKTIPAAKAAFSRECINPRFHGKNEWKSV